LRAEREILISILKLTREGPASIELIAKNSRIPLSVIEEQIKKFLSLNLAEKKGALIRVSPLQRLKIAFRAITLGADIERVCRNLSWKEFEDVAVTAFQTNGYSTIKHFRFRHENRMWEIDVLAVKGKIVLCVDCKRWMKRLAASTMSRVAKAQIERVKALSKNFSKIMDKSTFPAEGRIFLIPMILSLVPASSKFCNGVPIVPILQLQNFLDELPAHKHLLNFIEVKL